jgi:hypothetical protein
VQDNDLSIFTGVPASRGTTGGDVTGLSYRLPLAVLAAAISAVSAAAASADVATPPAGSPPGAAAAKRELLVAHDVMQNERITAAGASQVQLLFPDQSSLTLARDSDVSIDEFRYDPQARAGSLAATVRKGLVRYVGGRIAEENGVAFASPGGVVRLRGGIILLEARHEAARAATEAILLAGGRMCLAGNGQEECTSKTNTAITGKKGQAPSAPVSAAAATVQRWFGRLEGLTASELQRGDATE